MPDLIRCVICGFDYEKDDYPFPICKPCRNSKGKVPSTFYVSDELYIHFESQTDIRPQYKIVPISRGAGNLPMFLMTNPNEHFYSGSQSLIIRHDTDPFKGVGLPNFSAQKEMLNFWKDEIENNEELIKATPDKKNADPRKVFTGFNKLLRLNENRIVFAKLAQNDISESYFKNLKLSQHFKNIVRAYLLLDGVAVSPDIEYAFTPQLIQLTDGVLPARDVMPYQSHMLLVSHKKSGIMTLARRTATPFDEKAADVRARMLMLARLDATDVSERMEYGPMWSPIMFYESGELKAPLEELGSRLALICYCPDISNAQRVGTLPLPDERRCVELFQSLMATFTPKVEAVFVMPEVQKWLNEKIMGYSTEMSVAIDNSAMPEELRAFWTAHAENADRHIRGMAFKLAVLDYAAEIYQGKLDAAAFLEKAEEHVERICGMNKKSLKNMCDAENIDSAPPQAL